MNFLRYLGHFIRNILWALILIIIYFLLIGIIKNGGIVNYFHYLNARDWEVVASQINILEPHTLTDIFYSSNDISGAMIPEGNMLDGENLTGNILDSGNVLEDTGINVFDPKFQDDFNNNLEDSLSGTVESGSFGFVSTGV